MAESYEVVHSSSYTDQFNTNNKTYELTKYLITGKTINITDKTKKISDINIELTVDSTWSTGKYDINFYIIIGDDNNRYNSPYEENVKGSYHRVRLGISIPTTGINSVSVSAYNEYINASKVKLYMSVTRKEGSGTLYYRPDNTASKLTYILENGIHFSTPVEGSEFKQYSNLEAIIRNIQDEGNYQIYINNNKNSTIEEFNDVSPGDSLEYNKSIGGLQPGVYTLVCYKKGNNDLLCSVDFQVVENQIFSVIPEFSRYNSNGSSYESSFNGNYVGLKLNITTLASDFIDINYWAKVQYGNNNVKTFSGVVAQQFILDVFSLENNNLVLDNGSSITFSIYNDNDHENSIYQISISVPAPSVIFNVEDNGVAVGMLSTRERKFESAWPAIFYDSIYLIGTDANNETKYYKLYIDNKQLAVEEKTNIFSS